MEQMFNRREIELPSAIILAVAEVLARRLVVCMRQANRQLLRQEMIQWVNLEFLSVVQGLKFNMNLFCLVIDTIFDITD